MKKVFSDAASALDGVVHNGMTLMAGGFGLCGIPETVAEVEEIVEPGQLDPDSIHTPGIYVQRLILGRNYEKRIEQRTVRQKDAA